MKMGSAMTTASSPEHIIFDFERDVNVTKQRRFKHPTAALFHILFKISSVVVYLFGGLFGQGFLAIFVLNILLISMDFWTVKNVTGRLLVGLRWWNFIDDEGKSHWIFENSSNQQNNDDQKPINLSENVVEVTSSDSSIFWSALIITPIVWFILLLVSLFRLNVQWFIVVALSLVLSASNLYGYIRCKLGSTDIKAAVTQYVGKRIVSNFMSSSANKQSMQNLTPFPTA